MIDLADTNVLSETTKSRPSEGVLNWIAGQSPIRLSAVSAFELARGVELTTGKRRRFLEQWLAELLQGNAEIVPFDGAAAAIAASIEADARRRGRPIEARDLFIAATAKAHGMRIVTRNVAQFVGHGVVVHDPFVG